MAVLLALLSPLALISDLIGKLWLSQQELKRFATIVRCFTELGTHLEQVDKDLHTSWTLLARTKIPRLRSVRSYKKRDELQNAKLLVESACKAYLFLHGAERVVKLLDRSSTRWHQWRRIVAVPVSILVALIPLAMAASLLLNAHSKAQNVIGTILTALSAFLMLFVILLSDAVLLHEYSPLCFDLFSFVASAMRDEDLGKRKALDEITAAQVTGTQS
jgi:ABC-type sugar transport system permease subunit